MQTVPDQDPVTPSRLATDLGIGLALGALASSLPPVRRILLLLLTLFHELGHTVAAWLLGHPGLPALDLRYGGGVTTYGARSTLLLLGVYLFLGWCLHLLRANPRGRLVAGGLLLAYPVMAHTEFRHVLCLAAGHGAELVLGGIFLYRGLTGVAVVHEQERPLYLGVGGFVVFEGILFAWGLVSDPAARLRYQAAKGGGHWMDFSRLAERHLDVPLQAVAGTFLLACLLTPLVVAAVVAWREELRAWWREALRISPPASR